MMTSPSNSNASRRLRLLRRAAIATLGLLTFTTVPAAAEPPGPDQTGESGDTDVMIAHRPPPPAYRPYRPYYRPAPRRVYVAPTYYPRPRREFEPPPYNPIFHFGIGVNGTSVLSADGSTLTEGLGSGGGFDLGFGFRLAPEFSLDFNWMMSFHDAGNGAAGDEAALTHFSIDGRVFLTGRDRRLQPYIQAGIGAYILARDSWDYDTLSGVGFQLGGGLDFYLTRYVSIGAKLLYRGAHLDNAEEAWPTFPTESTWMSALSFGGDLKFHF